MQVSAAFGLLRAGQLPEDLVIHDLGACRDHRSQFPAVDNLGCPGGGVPGQPAISSMLRDLRLIRLTNEVRSSRGVQSSPMPAAVQTRLNIFRMFPGPAGWWCPRCLPSHTGQEPLISLGRPGVREAPRPPSGERPERAA